MEHLVEIAKFSKSSDNEIFCENCSEDNDEEQATGKPTATSYCINCRKNICNRCCKEHGKYQELKEHQLVAFGFTFKEQLMKKFDVYYYEQHIAIRSSIQLDLSAVSCSGISGVSKLDNKVFVFCHNPSSILVFDDQSPFQFQKKVETVEIRGSLDVAAIENSKCLFVSDCYNELVSYFYGCIWKITLDDYQVTKWLDKFERSYLISSSPDDHLLVLRQTEPLNRLDIYAPDGKLIRSLSLPAGVLEPFCCIQKTNGEFIISHIDGQTKLWTISQLSNNGQEIIRQFLPIDDMFKDFMPPYLFLDSSGDLLFVADSSNDRVLLMDPNSLHIKQIFLIGINILSGPMGLFCDSRKKQLFVHYSGRVMAHIFD